MNSARTIYHLARADFLERVRGDSFLVMLGLVVFLGYQTAIGNMALELGQYRGEFNSAWVGAMMSLIGTFFIGWFGFYLVKGSVARDRETGVGQIMASTPLTRLSYTFGKWLSNFAVLIAMLMVLVVMFLGAISFDKGCYPGQEIIARVHHLGGVKRHAGPRDAAADNCDLNPLISMQRGIRRAGRGRRRVPVRSG